MSTVLPPFALRMPTSDNLHLRNAMAVSEHYTDLRWSCALLRKFADLVFHGIRGGLQPDWWRAGVWNGRRADTLAVAVKTTHVGGVVELSVVARAGFLDARFFVCGGILKVPRNAEFAGVRLVHARHESSNLHLHLHVFFLDNIECSW